MSNMRSYWASNSLFEKCLVILLMSLNLIFLFYWIVLSANYCMHYDDVHFMWKLRDNSIYYFVKDMYMTRGGNFIAYGLTAIIFKLSLFVGDYHLWPIIFYVIGISITYAAFKDLFKINKFNLLLGIVALYNVYIITSVDYAIFTWLCAMGYFLFAPSICLIIKYINLQSLNLRQLVVLFLLGAFIAGNSVSISTITFVLLFVNGMWLWYHNKWNVVNTWNNPSVKRLIYFTIFMLLIFVIVVVAPGNYARMNGVQDIEQPQSISQFFIACIKCMGMFTYLNVFYIPYQILALFLGIIVGAKCEKIQINISLNKLVFYIVLAYLAWTIITVLPLAYLSNGFKIQRNYTQLTFFLLLTFYAVGFLLGNHSHKLYHSDVISIIISFFLIVVMGVNCFQDLPIVRQYSKAHAARERQLIELQKEGNKETIVVQPFPSTHTPDAKYNVLTFFGKKTNMQAIYYESDTDIEPNEYEKHIRKLLYLNYDFILSEPKIK